MREAVLAVERPDRTLGHRAQQAECLGGAGARQQVFALQVTDGAGIHAGPEMRQTLAVETVLGALNHSGLSLAVAVFMNVVQNGTAMSAANPLGRMVCG